MPSWRDNIPVAIGWRYVAHSAMVGIALWNEARPAPSLPDSVLDWVPRVGWIADHNYHLWLLCYIPVAIGLWRADRRAFVQFLWLGGWLSLLRGVCIVATGLGPVHGADVNAGMDGGTMWRTWVAIVNPFTALMTDAPHRGLTKDLFFSGHVATTFLLWLYCRPHRRLAAAAMAGHVVVTASVFFAHLHYTIDVLGAWAITGWVWMLVSKRWPIQAAAVEVEKPEEMFAGVR